MKFDFEKNQILKEKGKINLKVSEKTITAKKTMAPMTRAQKRREQRRRARARERDEEVRVKWGFFPNIPREDLPNLTIDFPEELLDIHRTADTLPKGGVVPESEWDFKRIFDALSTNRKTCSDEECDAVVDYARGMTPRDIMNYLVYKHARCFNHFVDEVGQACEIIKTMTMDEAKEFIEEHGEEQELDEEKFLNKVLWKFKEDTCLLHYNKLMSNVIKKLCSGYAGNNENNVQHHGHPDVRDSIRYLNCVKQVIQQLQAVWEEGVEHGFMSEGNYVDVLDKMKKEYDTWGGLADGIQETEEQSQHSHCIRFQLDFRQTFWCINSI